MIAEVVAGDWREGELSTSVVVLLFAITRKETGDEMGRTPMILQ